MLHASAPGSTLGNPRTPMAGRLLDRQTSLLEYLTSGSAIFGDEAEAPLNPDLRGVDRSLLRLKARFSFEKRMEKINAVFPRTFELLADHLTSIEHEFVEACPPIDIDRLENARQFYGFLAARGNNEATEPPYLRDVAACELARALARVGAEDRRLEPNNGATRAPQGCIRRRSGVILLRCAYDVRSVFEGGSGEAVPVKRETPLVISFSDGAEQPQVSEVLPVIFDLLGALDDWTDPAAFGDAPELKELIHQMELHGLIEVHA